MVDNNLLDITTVPIKVEINITKGELTNPKVNNPDRALKMDINTSKGQLKIHSEPPKIKIDTYAARSSMGYGQYNNMDMLKAKGSDGFSIAYQGVARIASEGNQLAKGVSPAEIAAQNMRAGQTIQTIMEFLPKTGADVTFEEGVLNINYEMGEVDINAVNSQVVPFEFVPGRVEFEVTQMPKVTIEYLGEPIYVPPMDSPSPVMDVKG